ncbi:unnamed protein product [Prorocentrum cordatum]|uniref:Uncharacterized protein n=1 Tax=Prorocentrum cordatum TaxID=2364126 RepID=A0ABN9QUN7_9DINO|nr:unnamed protein product [Polarella glacialis]
MATASAMCRRCLQARGASRSRQVVHAALLRSDGAALARGFNGDGQRNFPPLPAGQRDVQVAAGSDHTVLLMSDGMAVARGGNRFGKCDLPPLPAGQRCAQVAAGSDHAALLRSDGAAASCGSHNDGQRNVPPLPAGRRCAQVAAGSDRAVLLRSDGAALARGFDGDGQCDLPPLMEGLTYAPHPLPTLLLQASVDAGTVHFVTFGGEDRCQIAVAPDAPLTGVRAWLLTERRLGRPGLGLGRVDAVLPGGGS